MSTKRILVIYHGGCPDGVAAAWCVQHKHSTEVASGAVDIVPYAASHNKPPPWRRIKKADEVYILDFAYDRADMEKIASQVELTVLDHHKSAEAKCRGLNFCEFDMNRSGAGMSWDHFFSRETRPWFINYIEDRDIWNWKFPDAKAALAYFDTLDLNFDTFDDLFLNKITLLSCIERGVYILQYIAQYNAETIASSLRIISFADPSGVVHTNVPILNASYTGISAILHTTSKRHQFSLGYYRRADGKYKYSIRASAASDFDCSQLAGLYPGGGGHAKAAGFTIDRTLEEL